MLQQQDSVLTLPLKEDNRDGPSFNITNHAPKQLILRGRYARIKAAIMNMRPGQYLTSTKFTGKEEATKWRNACSGSWTKQAGIKIKSSVCEDTDGFCVVVQRLPDNSK